MDSSKKERLLSLVRSESDQNAAKELYLMCGRDGDWDSAFEAVQLLANKNLLGHTSMQLVQKTFSRLERLEKLFGIEPQVLEDNYGLTLFETSDFCISDIESDSQFIHKLSGQIYAPDTIYLDKLLMTLDFVTKNNTYQFKDCRLSCHIEIGQNGRLFSNRGNVTLPFQYGYTKERQTHFGIQSMIVVENQGYSQQTNGMYHEPIEITLSTNYLDTSESCICQIYLRLKAMKGDF